jgi:carboxylesterase
MRYLGERLHARGYSVAGVRLPGHATLDGEMLRAGSLEWAAAAHAGLDALRRTCDTVVVIGLSMGALLALDLAHGRAADVAGIVAMAVPLELRDRRLRRYAPLLRALLPVLPARWLALQKVASDIADGEARRVHPRFPMPLRGLVDLVALQRAVRPKLGAISQPLLIIHGLLDNTCPPVNAEILRREIGSAVVRSRLLEQSAHVLTVDAERDVVAHEVAAFLEALASSHREAGRTVA